MVRDDSKSYLPLTTLSKCMDMKFKINQTKVKGGLSNGEKKVTPLISYKKLSLSNLIQYKL